MSVDSVPNCCFAEKNIVKPDYQKNKSAIEVEKTKLCAFLKSGDDGKGYEYDIKQI
jgi:hypothetical protein